MSEQRKFRSELRQGLHQFLMQMYESYVQNHSEADAKLIVAEVVEEQYRYFYPEGLAGNQAEKVLTARIKELTDKLNATNDYDTQMYYAERIDSLSAAIEVLKTNI